MRAKIGFAILFLILPASSSGDIVVSLADIEVEAYPSDVALPLFLDNLQDEIGGLQFDVAEVPEMISAVDVEAIGRAAGFDVSFTNLENGDLRVVLVSTTGQNISAGSDSVLIIHYGAQEIPSALIGLDLVNLVVSDSDGVELDAAAESGSIKIGPTAALYVTGATADAAEPVDIYVGLTNEADVGGIQFDLKDSPNLLTIDSVWTTDRALGFSADWSEIAGFVRVVVWDVGNGVIVPGEGHVVGIRAVVDPFAHAGDIELTFTDAVVSDEIGGSIWIDTLGTGAVSVWPGYLDPPLSLIAEGGLDGLVPLAWEAPTGGGGGDFGALLLVDDDDSQLNDDGSAPYYADVGGIMTEDLAAFGAVFDYYEVESGGIGPALDVLGNYDVVIWMTGYEWGYNPPLTVTDEANLGAYMDAGGKVILIGEDIIYGGSGAFVESYFGASLNSEDAGTPDPLVGVSGTEFDGASYAATSIFYNPDGFYEDYGDDLYAQGSSEGKFDGTAGAYAVVGNEHGLFWGVEYAFITEQADRQDALQRMSDALAKHGYGIPRDTGAVGPRQIVHQAKKQNPLLDPAFSPVRSVAVAQGFPVPEQHGIVPSAVVEAGRYLVGFNIYRSEASGGPYGLLDAVDASTLSYDDTTVTNGTWYYYVISADYGDMGESEYSNEAAALPAEWVYMGMTSGAAISGYTDTIWVSLSNASPVGDFSLTIEDIPDALTAEDVVSTDRTLGFSIGFSELPGGAVQVTFAQVGDPVAPGEGAVCGIIYRASSTVEIDVDLVVSEVSAQSPEGNIYMVGTEGGQFHIFVETQYASLGSGFAEPGGEGSIVLNLSNTQPIYGFEIFVADNPDVLTGVSVIATDRVPSTIVLSGSDIDGIYWITAVGFAGEAIEPGSGPVVEITFSVAADAEPETIVNLDYTSYQFWGPGQSEIYTMFNTSSFAVGIPEALFSFGEGSAAPGGTGTYTIDLDNSVDVFGFQIFIEDFPDWLAVTTVEATERIPADASMSWYEFTDGTLRVLEFDMTPPVEGVTPGSGPILVVTVDAIPSAVLGSVVGLSFIQSVASDAEGNPTIFSFGSGNWFYIGEVGIDGVMLNVVPDEFALHQNYPNPFNPVTTVAFDLPEASDVEVKVLNVLGQEVVTLLKGHREAGAYQVVWNGLDQYGLPVNSGVYFYQILSKNFTATRKMILLK